MKKLFLILNWAFGGFLLLVGVVIAVQAPISGGTLMLASFFMIPPIREFFYSKTNKEISIGYRSLIIIILFGIGITTIPPTPPPTEAQIQERKLAKEKAEVERIKKIENQNIKYFEEHKVKILTEIGLEIQMGNYKEAISKASKYLPSKDEELIGRDKEAKDSLEKKQKEQREQAVAKAKKQEEERLAKVQLEREASIKRITEELKTTPPAKYKQNQNLYSKLLSYEPENKKYKEKVKFYTDKVNKEKEIEIEKQRQEEKKSQERRAKFGNPPVASAWDGSYHVVESYLKRVANDPDSIEMDGCTEISYTEHGWLVGCNYRGRNGFGGMVRQSNWFTIRHDTVIKMDKTSAYSL